MKPSVLTFVKKVGIKTSVAAVFSAVWCLLLAEGVSANAPLSLFAALYLAGAWLSYLKKDGLAIFRTKRPIPTTAARIDAPIIEELVSPEDEEEEMDEAAKYKLGINSSVAAAALLVATSFLFPS